jgi:invasion protein IalB
MEDNLFANNLRSNALALAFGALTLAAAASGAHAQSAQPAAQAPKTETFGSWGMTCAQPNACQIQQTLGNKEKKFVAALVHSKANGQNILMAVVPLGFRLQNNPELRVDNGAPIPGAYVQCLAAGCRIGFEGSDATMKALQSGAKASVTLMSPQNKPVPVVFDLKGFGDAKKALDQKVK